MILSGTDFKMIFSDPQINARKVSAVTGKVHSVSVAPDCESLLVQSGRSQKQGVYTINEPLRSGCPAAFMKATCKTENKVL